MVIDSKFSKTQAIAISDLLKSNIKLKVPKFQRNYSWDRDKVETLWLDILENFHKLKNKAGDAKESQYLLGSVVLVKSDKESMYYVIDGQQRLSTLLMLYCAARDIILEHSSTTNNSKPDGLEQINMMIRNTLGNKHSSWKLELNDTDKKLFREILEYENEVEIQLERLKKMTLVTKSEKYLRGGYVVLYDNIISGLNTNFNEKTMSEKENKRKDESRRQTRMENIGTLNQFLRHVEENNFIIRILVADDETAFQIFETLNERGQELSKSNLIKNHIINKVDEDDIDLQDELSDQWNKIFDDVIRNEEKDDDFIVESMRSRNSDLTITITPKNLYKIVKERVKDEKTCRTYINELTEDADILKLFNNPSSYPDNKTRNEIYALKELKATHIRVPILTAYRQWGLNDQYRTLVKILVKFFFKFRVVRQKHPGDVGRIVGEITQKIINGESFNSILNLIKEKDDHEDFKYNFKNNLMSDISKSIAKYILQEFTLYLGDAETYVIPLDNLVLESILPVKQLSTWNEDDFFKNYDNKGKQMKDFAKQLGNLTLLEKPLHPRISNAKFHNKKKNELRNGDIIGYSTSKLAINRETVCIYDEWTAKIIEKREEKFVEYADIIWDLDKF